MNDSPQTIAYPEVDASELRKKMRKKYPTRKAREAAGYFDNEDYKVTRDVVNEEDKKLYDKGLWKTEKGWLDLRSRMNRAKNGSPDFTGR